MGTVRHGGKSAVAASVTSVDATSSAPLPSVDPTVDPVRTSSADRHRTSNVARNRRSVPTSQQPTRQQQQQQQLCLCSYLSEDNDYIEMHNRYTNIGGSSESPFSSADDGNAHDTVLFMRDTRVRCSACVQRALRSVFERRRQAQQEHRAARLQCQTQLRQSDLFPLADLQAESHRLRDRLARLRTEIGTMTVAVAAQAVDNDDRRERHPDGTSHRLAHLRCLETFVLDEGMQHTLVAGTERVRMLRLLWARKAFLMHRLVVDPDDIRPANSVQALAQGRRRARGIGKIGGLPLPHAGPELYGVLPPRELRSALRLVASLTSTVAKCLGILLPHPLLLAPPGTSDNQHTQPDILETALVDDNRTPSRPRTVSGPSAVTTTTTTTATPTSPSPITAPSRRSSAPPPSSSLFSYVGGSLLKKSAKTAYAYATGKSSTTTFNNTTRPRSNSIASVESLRDNNNNTDAGSSGATANANVGGNNGGGSSNGQSQSSSCTTPATASYDPSTVGSHHAAAAAATRHAMTTVIAEGTGIHSQQFSTDEEEVALQLLQNNIIALCIRAGVPVQKLWPAEAVLLNLYALQMHCEDQSASPY